VLAADTASSTQPVATSPTPETFHFLLEFKVAEQLCRYQIGARKVEAEFVLGERFEVQNCSSGQWDEILDRSGRVVRVDGYEKDLQIDANLPCLPAVSTLLPDLGWTPLIVETIEFLRSIRYYPLDEPSLPSMDDEPVILSDEDYRKWVAQQKVAREANASVVKRLVHMKQERLEDYEELTHLLGPDGLDVIDDILIGELWWPEPEGRHSSGENDDKSKMYYLTTFTPSGVPKDPGRQLSYSLLSLGTRRLLRILVSLFYDRSSILLIEQPEDCIHAGLLYKLIYLLKTYADPAQFIMASHSPVVFNCLDAEEVRLVTMDNGRTSVRALTKQEMKAAEGYMQKEGTLAEFLESVEEA